MWTATGGDVPRKVRGERPALHALAAKPHAATKAMAARRYTRDTAAKTSNYRRAIKLSQASKGMWTPQAPSQSFGWNMISDPCRCVFSQRGKIRFVGSVGAEPQGLSHALWHGTRRMRRDPICEFRSAQGCDLSTGRPSQGNSSQYRRYVGHRAGRFQFTQGHPSIRVRPPQFPTPPGKPAAQNQYHRQHDIPARGQWPPANRRRYHNVIQTI